MTTARARRALALLALVLAPALAGCTSFGKGPIDGEGHHVLAIRNGTNNTATFTINVYHSSERAIPNANDPHVDGELRVDAGDSGAFLFSLPDDIRAARVSVNGHGRLMVPHQLADCTVMMFTITLRSSVFDGCLPGEGDGNATSG